MVAEHREVVAAIAASDPDAAERALRHHLRMVLSYVPDIRAPTPSTSRRTESMAVHQTSTR